MMILLWLCLGLTAGAMILGLVSMVLGSKLSPKWSAHFMTARVIFQGLTLLLLAGLAMAYGR